MEFYTMDGGIAGTIVFRGLVSPLGGCYISSYVHWDCALRPPLGSQLNQALYDVAFKRNSASSHAAIVNCDFVVSHKKAILSQLQVISLWSAGGASAQEHHLKISILDFQVVVISIHLPDAHGIAGVCMKQSCEHVPS